MVTRQPHHEYDDEDADDPMGTGECADVAAYVLGVLGPVQQGIFAEHLAGCEGCQRDAADFGVFMPMVRVGAGRGAFVEPAVAAVMPMPCRITRNVTRGLLMVATGFVVALMAVLSVVESLSTHTGEPVDMRTRTHARPADVEPFPLFRDV